MTVIHTFPMEFRKPRNILIAGTLAVTALAAIISNASRQPVSTERAIRERMRKEQARKSALTAKMLTEQKEAKVKALETERLKREVDRAEAALVAERNFVPGVEGRAPDEVCQTSSAACQQWTELARKCEENMRARFAGDMSPQQPYCSQAEAFRERVTGIELSSAPGAYSF